jgi:hypothetical protein
MLALVANALRQWKLASPKNHFDPVFPSLQGVIEAHTNYHLDLGWGTG